MRAEGERQAGVRGGRLREKVSATEAEGQGGAKEERQERVCVVDIRARARALGGARQAARVLARVGPHLHSG